MQENKIFYFGKHPSSFASAFDYLCMYVQNSRNTSPEFKRD